MRTTVTLNDELVETAMKYTGITDKSELIREALKRMIQLEAGRRLAAIARELGEGFVETAH